MTVEIEQSRAAAAGHSERDVEVSEVLAVTAVFIAAVQLGIDAAAHLASFQAPLGRTGTDLGIVVVLVAGLAVGVDAARPRRPGGHRLSARLLVPALLMALALALRWHQGPNNPPGRFVAPIELVAAALLGVACLRDGVRWVFRAAGATRLSVAVAAAAVGALVVRLLVASPAALPGQRASELRALAPTAAALSTVAVTMSAWRHRRDLGRGMRRAWSAIRRCARRLRPRRREGRPPAEVARPEPRVSRAPLIDRRDRVPAAVMLVVTLAGAAIGWVWAVRIGWVPTGDAARVLARAWDVGTRNTPLLGMPTGLGGSASPSYHPGPILFDLLAPFVRLFGLRFGGFIGALVLNVGSLVVAVVAAYLVDGRRGAVGAWVIGTAVLTFAGGKGATWETNNLSPSIVAVFACLMLCWAAASRRPGAWPWAVAAAALCTQAYIPDAVITTVPMLWAGSVLAVQWRRGPDHRGPRRALRHGLIVGAVLWAQPALQAITHSGGNLIALWHSLFDERRSVGWTGMLKAVGWTLRVPPVLNRLQDLPEARASVYFGGLGVSGWVVFVALIAYWVRSRSAATDSVRRLRTLSLVVLLSAGFSLWQLPVLDDRFYYLIFLGVATCFMWFVVGHTVLTALDQFTDQASRWLRRASVQRVLLGAAGLTVVACGVATPPMFNVDWPDMAAMNRAIPVLVEKMAAVRPSSQGVLVISLDQMPQELTDSLTSYLITLGRPVRVEQEFGNYFTAGRVAPVGWTGPALMVLDGSAPPPDGAGRLVARVVPSDWSQSRFERTAARVKQWAITHGPIRLSSTARSALPAFLDGSASGVDCRYVEAVHSGAVGPARLSAIALARLYARGGVASPRLPPAIRSQLDAEYDRVPIDVRMIHLRAVVQPTGDQLLNTGQLCS